MGEVGAGAGERMTMNRPIVFDRSRRETDDECSRARYLAYEMDGHGIERIGRDIALETGTFVHVGLDALTKGGAVEQVVAETIEAYRKSASKNQVVAVAESTSQSDIAIEQAALIEAQLRGWAAVRKPLLDSIYEVLESEQEYSLTFPTGETFLMRLDRLERRKSDGAIFLRDFKTTGDPSSRWRTAFRFNQQTISMVLPVEATHNVKVAGVIIEGLVKGKRLEYPKGSGCYQQSSPLIYAWRKAAKNPPFDEDRWASRYEWQCTDAHTMDSGKTCGGNASHRLSGFYKAAVWREFPGGVKGWLDYLLEHDRSLVEEQFVELPPTMRSEWEVNEWLLSSLAREREIAERVERVEADPALLPVLFPKQTNGGHNCIYCQFADVCWGPYASDPLASGLYRPRRANHPQEIELREAAA